MADVGDEIDRLYGLPLDEFTAARNRLAAQLKKEGEADEAERVRTLSKPSVTAWAINQLARRERRDVEALLAAGERVREAQATALGGGSADAVPAAERELRERVQALTRAAQGLLADAGRSASAATVDRIAVSLRGAALDPEATELLAQGRLTEDVEPTGFEALFGVVPAQAPPTRAPATTKRADQRRREREQRRGELEEARSRHAEAREALKAAEQRARAAERELEAAEAERERALAAAESAAERVAAAEAAVREHET